MREIPRVHETCAHAYNAGCLYTTGKDNGKAWMQQTDLSLGQHGFVALISEYNVWGEHREGLMRKLGATRSGEGVRGEWVRPVVQHDS